MSDPTDEQIEAGRMVLVDMTGHGYGPDLVRAVYDAMQAVAPGPSPAETAKNFGRWAYDQQSKALVAAYAEIERLKAAGRKLVDLTEALIDNDPDDLCADGGITVLMVWRKGAATALTQWKEARDHATRIAGELERIDHADS